MNSTYLKRLALAAVMMTTMAIDTAALPPAPTDSLPARNKVKVSLVTFYPGDEVFSNLRPHRVACGHRDDRQLFQLRRVRLQDTELCGSLCGGRNRLYVLGLPAAAGYGGHGRATHD